MRRVRISGDAYAIGCQLGVLARDAFARVLPRIERYRQVTDDCSASERLRDLEAAGRRAFPDGMREIDGIADGAGIPFQTVFAWNCRGDFPGGGEQTALAGCTDVMALAADSALMAHNEDDQPELDGECMMVDVRPERGLDFVSFYSPGLLPGHTFACNQAGLVQTINHLRTHDQRVGVPRHLLCRAVLNCADADAALALIRATPRAGGFHHNLGTCRPWPRLLSIEAPASGVVVKQVTAAHAQAHANHLLASELRDVVQTIAPSSAARQARAAQLAAQGIRNADAALAVLADEGNAEWPIRRKARAANDPGFTLASSVFELRAQRLQWRVFRDPAAAPLFEQAMTLTPPA